MFHINLLLFLDRMISTTRDGVMLRHRSKPDKCRFRFPMVAVMVPCMIHIPVRADYQSVGPPLRCVPMIFGKVIFFICNGPTIHVQAWQMAFLIPVRDPKFALFAERARSG